MLTKEQVLEAIKGGKKSECLDGRDYARMCDFFPVLDWKVLGFALEEGKPVPEPTPWTRENIIKQLTKDVAFGFKKALNKRGISSSFMVSTVKTWMWVLEDELENFEEYAQYGLPFFKAVALKYNLPNPIGDDHGNEKKYSSGGDDDL